MFVNLPASMNIILISDQLAMITLSLQEITLEFVSSTFNCYANHINNMLVHPFGILFEQIDHKVINESSSEFLNPYL